MIRFNQRLKARIGRAVKGVEDLRFTGSGV
jgi:hypothetical protein